MLGVSTSPMVHILLKGRTESIDNDTSVSAIIYMTQLPGVIKKA